MPFEGDVHIGRQRGEIGSGSYCMSLLSDSGGASGGIIQLGHLEDLLEGMVVNSSLHAALMNHGAEALGLLDKGYNLRTN